MKKRILIIDALALAYKAYFAFIQRPLITKKGEPTSAVYGFLTQFIKICEDNKPDGIIVAFDSHEKTFRHDKYENYKAQRQQMPDDMMSQIERIKEIIGLLNIPVVIKPGFEADDLIGTLAKRGEKEGYQVYIVSPDKDLTQMISENITVVRPGGRTITDLSVYDLRKFGEKYGFLPVQMIDYLALLGDNSDNIPGVKGIGEKQAQPLIQQYGTIENLYLNLDQIEKKSTRERLLEGKEEAFISKELATIDCNVDVNLDFKSTEFGKIQQEQLRDIFVELEFRTIFPKVVSLFRRDAIIEELPSEEKGSEYQLFDQSKVKYNLISEYDKAKELADYLNKQEIFAFDTETDSLNIAKMNLIGVSFSANINEAFFVALNASAPDGLFRHEAKDRLDVDIFVQLFKPVLENKNIKKVCQNAKFDIAVLRNYGIEVQNMYFDTMLASYILDPDQKHSMDELSKKYLSYLPIPISTILGIKKDSTKIYHTDLNQLSCYSCEDADITLRLHNVLIKELERTNLHELAYKVEFPLVQVLEDMERTGVNVDREVLRSLSKDFQILLENYSKSIFEMCGEEFNIGSPQQLQRILFEKLELKKGKKIKTGFSTDAKSLEALQGVHPVIDILMQYRQVAKLKSTYSDSLPNLIRPTTGRIHTCFNQTIASTGRLSSTDPNLQNIPIRTDMGKEIRKAFVPRDENYIILSADYSQIELRIMAHLADDENLKAAFINNDDIHRNTASLVFEVPKDEVTPEMRRRAKEVNFGILYGIGVFGLKTRLGVTQTHAKEIIETYFKRFGKVKYFMETSILRASDTGYAETILGRRRYLRNINSSNKMVKQFEERVAINMPIQGTAADMIKLAMINIHSELKKRKLKTKMVLQVHDELLFDAHKEELDEVKVLIKNLMENALPLSVPIVADLGIGQNWLDAH